MVINDAAIPVPPGTAGHIADTFKQVGNCRWPVRYSARLNRHTRSGIRPVDWYRTGTKRAKDHAVADTAASPKPRANPGRHAPVGLTPGRDDVALEPRMFGTPPGLPSAVSNMSLLAAVSRRAEE